MSITSVSGYMSPWQRPGLQNLGTSRSGMAALSDDSMAKAGTVSTNGNVIAYTQAFSAELQAMLTQMAGEAGPPVNSTNGVGTSSTTASAAGSADPSQDPNALHRRYHHNGHGEGDDGTIDDGARHLVGGIEGATQGATQTANQISNPSSLFATDVTRALASYGSATLDGSLPADKSTVA